MAVVASICAAITIVLALVYGSPTPLELVIMALVEVMFVAFYFDYTRRSAAVNRLAIFEGGIAPPRKPKSHRGTPSIVPFSEIEQMNSEGKGEYVTVQLKNGERLGFSVSSAFAVLRPLSLRDHADRKEVRRARTAFQALVQDFARWKASGEEGVFACRPETDGRHA